MSDVVRSKSNGLNLHFFHVALSVGVSGVLVLAIVSLSLWMTHSSPMALTWGQIAIALLIPLASGIFSVLYPRTMEQVLDAIADMSSTLPF